MNKIWKFLMRMPRKEREYLLHSIFPKIVALELKGLDIKPLEGHKDIFRVRKGEIRIVFFRDDKNRKGIILKVGNRRDIYKKH